MQSLLLCGALPLALSCGRHLPHRCRRLILRALGLPLLRLRRQLVRPRLLEVALPLLLRERLLLLRLAQRLARRLPSDGLVRDPRGVGELGLLIRQQLLSSTLT